MIKHIVFDFGGVILNLDGVHTTYANLLAEVFRLPLDETREIWNQNKTGVLIGKESPRIFLERMKREGEFDFDIDEAYSKWKEHNVITRDRIDWEIVKILEKLKANYQVHMLTDQIDLENGAAEWIEEITRHFHTIFRSYEQGFRKPDYEAFYNMLEKIGAKSEPETVIFIDDTLANITAANELGIHGVLYKFQQHEVLEKIFSQLRVVQ